MNTLFNILHGTYINLFYAPAEFTEPPFLNYGGHDSVKYTYRLIRQSERSFQYFVRNMQNSVLCSGVLRATLNLFDLQFTLADVPLKFSAVPLNIYNR